MRDLYREIESFRPGCPQEERDRALMLQYIEHFDDVLTRENTLCHFSASGWIVNPARDRTLMAYHNIYRSWSWTGGHADGESDLLAVAIREAAEETGVTAVPVTEDLYSLEILTVDGHFKRGAYVSSHVHLNLTYLLTADDTAPIREKPDENSGVRWFGLEEAVAACTETAMPEIYRKLNARLPAGNAGMRLHDPRA